MTPEQKKTQEDRMTVEAQRLNLKLDAMDLATRAEYALYLMDMARAILQGERLQPGHMKALFDVLGGEDRRRIAPFDVGLTDSFRRLLNAHQAKCYIARSGDIPAEDGRSYGFGVAFLVVGELAKRAGRDYTERDFNKAEEAQRALIKALKKALAGFRKPRAVSLLQVPKKKGQR